MNLPISDSWFIFPIHKHFYSSRMHVISIFFYRKVFFSIVGISDWLSLQKLLQKQHAENCQNRTIYKIEKQGYLLKDTLVKMTCRSLNESSVFRNVCKLYYDLICYFRCISFTFLYILSNTERVEKTFSG